MSLREAAGMVYRGDVAIPSSVHLRLTPYEIAALSLAIVKVIKINQKSTA
jgi:hypothetical protein